MRSRFVSPASVMSNRFRLFLERKHRAKILFSLKWTPCHASLLLLLIFGYGYWLKKEHFFDDTRSVDDSGRLDRALTRRSRSSVGYGSLHRRLHSSRIPGRLLFASS